MTGPARTNAFGIVSANISGKAHETFLFFLLAGHADFVCVNDDDEVTGIDVRCENRFLFSAQKICRLHGDVTQDLIFGIDQPPFAVDFTGFSGKRLHRRLEKGTETTGREGHCQPMESAADWALKVLSRNYNAPQYSSPSRFSFFLQFRH